jgi:hypothetical protein
MESLYKIGDNVLIKKKYDPGCKGLDYSYYFAENMLTEYGGRVCTISKAKYRHKMQDGRLPDDGYLYSIEEDGGCLAWVSSMFEAEF